MAKNLKLNIKNAQLAEAVNLSGLKSKIAKKKQEKAQASTQAEPVKEEGLPKEEVPRVKARSKSAFAEKAKEEFVPHVEPEPVEETLPSLKTSAEIRQEIFSEELKAVSKEREEQNKSFSLEKTSFVSELIPKTPSSSQVVEESLDLPFGKSEKMEEKTSVKVEDSHSKTKLGPTGKHVNDYLKPAKPVIQTPPSRAVGEKEQKVSVKPRTENESKAGEEDSSKKSGKIKFKEFKDLKAKKPDQIRQFDVRDRQGLRNPEEDREWRKKRPKAQKMKGQEDVTIRPTFLSVRLPISLKDLAAEMKLKASQLIGKLFLHGMTLTLNDLLEDETIVQLLGEEFGCTIEINRTEEKRIRITDKTIKEELLETLPKDLKPRPTVVAFMGHVDHGKTSLIDAIRKSNRVAGEVGAITQHIGAFLCHTEVGVLTILDTPGHEAFSSMRARGAEVTDIAVLVVAGDEGLKTQSLEAIQQAKEAGLTIVVAINKSDKPNFNPEMVYRQLSEQELLPEAWGGQVITVNCSALTGQGIKELLEMLALQAEVLELKANPSARARGTVLESEMHKGFGPTATVLIQNGSLKKGDALVFGQLWGRIKTMRDERGRELLTAPPSTPVQITGLSGLPDAGQEFIVVKNEQEAKEIAAARVEGVRQFNLQKKKVSIENLLQQAATVEKKVLNVILRADVHGSLEALTTALLKIQSNKVNLNIIFGGVGEISESDVQLAATSKAIILGFHTGVESHAESLVKELGVQVRLHSIIYHAVDDIKALMKGLLEKIPQETDKGKAIVRAIFKSSQLGTIAGCQVTEGIINRNYHLRLIRGKEMIWKGTIASLKRLKDDVKEVPKGLECGIIPNNFSDIREGDIFEAYEITYLIQEL